MANETDVANEVLRSVRRMMRRVAEHSRWMSRELGLTLPQLVCIKAIGALEEAGESEITVVMVAKEVSLSAATVSRILDRLVNSGLIARERRSKDRRKVCLTLTASGVERQQTLPPALQERFVERLNELPLERREVLLESLRQVCTLMEADELSAAPMLVAGTGVKIDTEQ